MKPGTPGSQSWVYTIPRVVGLTGCGFLTSLQAVLSWCRALSSHTLLGWNTWRGPLQILEVSLLAALLSLVFCPTNSNPLKPSRISAVSSTQGDFWKGVLPCFVSWKPQTVSGSNRLLFHSTLPWRYLLLSDLFKKLFFIYSALFFGCFK